MTLTLTSTPGSNLNEVTSLTSSDGQNKSITLLWILISYLSQVLVPSPHGLFLVVILRVLVGIRTGPLTLNSWSFDELMIWLQVASNAFTFKPVMVSLYRKLLDFSRHIEIISSIWVVFIGGTGRCTLF